MRDGSMPRSLNISDVTACSESKYNTTPSGLSFKNFATIPIAKNVLPVALSPASAMILLSAIPPYKLPLSNALNANEPVSTNPLTSDSTPSETTLASSLLDAFTILFKKLLI